MSPVLAHVLALFVVFSAGTSGAQRAAPDTWMSNASRVISPAVVATWIAEQQRSGAQRLEVLVLWRGRPAWFVGGTNSSRTWSAGRSGARESGERQGPIDHEASFGDVTLKLRFDPATRMAWVQGREVSLERANVVLVDDVDSPQHLNIVGTRQLDPELEGAPPRIELLLRRSPELIAFLRCETAVQNPVVQKVIEAIVCSAEPRR